MFIIATWIDALLQQYNVFFSLEGEQPVVCGSLNSGGYGTLNHYELWDFAQSYGVRNAS